MKTKMKRFLFILALCVILIVFGDRKALASTDPIENTGINLIENGSFERTQNGMILDWEIRGDKTVHQNLSLDSGRTSGYSAKLECSSFERKTRQGYAQLIQHGKMKLEKGKWYRFSCWAKQENMVAGMVTVELQIPPRKGNYWYSTLLFYQLPLKQQWQHFERYFKVDDIESGKDATELAFYFDFVGTLWLDDVRITPVDEPSLEYVSRIPHQDTTNLLPNASFECGTDGWSSLGKRPGWIGGLSGLYGTIQKNNSWDGTACLQIELGPGKTPLASFDFFKTNTIEQHSPLVANIGWIEVQPGKKYTLSAYMRADQDGIPVKMQVRFSEPLKGMDDGSSYITRDQVAIESDQVALTQKWQRFAITVPASYRYAFVAVGPDMTTMPDKEATVWIDAIQLQQSDEASRFETRFPVELGIHTEKFGNVFDSKEPRVIKLSASNCTSTDTSLEVHVKVTDYFEKVVHDEVRHLKVSAIDGCQIDWKLPLEKGYYNLWFSWECCGQPYSRKIPVAVVDSYPHQDSVFGVNHAPGTDECCRQLCKAGVLWAREWALNWQHIESTEGVFDYSETDRHINRVLKNGMRMVQQLPPFPSTKWNSTAPPEFTEQFPGFANFHGKMAFPPKDPEVFKRFIGKTVEHYQNRIKIWEYLNEPFYTTHSFPNVEQLDAATNGIPGANFTVLDYLDWLKIMYASVKAADPQAQVIGGLSARPDLLSKEFFQAGGLAYVDIFNLHIYPGLRRPEGYIQQMQQMLEEMDKSPSGKRPVWITEYAYFSADTLPWKPFIVGPGPWAANRILEDEKQGGDYLVRYATIMLAHGVEKIFYHNGAGINSEVNEDLANLESWMLAYGGVPRKAYVAQSVLSNMLGPNPQSMGPWKNPPSINGKSTKDVFGYSFQCSEQAVLIAWTPNPENSSQTWAIEKSDTVQAYNIMGNPIDLRRIELGESPIYLVSKILSAKELTKQVLLYQ